MDALFAAARFAEAQGWSFSRHCTIQLQHAPGPPAEALRAILERVRHWLTYHGAPVAYVWTWENGPLHGVHVHLLIHVPASLTAGFAKELRRVHARILGEPPGKALNIRPAWSLDGVRYIAKGCSARAAARYGIRREPGGTIEGKRCGVSQSLGQKARGKAGKDKNHA